MNKTLLSAEIGHSAMIYSLAAKGLSNRRLLDLGMTPGTRITCLYAAPSGDPRAYLVRGTVIALRENDAKNVLIC